MSLEPLRRAALEQARADAEKTSREAVSRASRIVGDAEREGAALMDHARADAGAAAAARAARELASVRRAARAVVLQTKRELHDELRRRSREAALRLRADPAYPELVEALCEVARGQLGEAAELEIDPPDVGGVRAVAASRSVDYSLPALAERCVGRLGARIEDLWA